MLNLLSMVIGSQILALAAHFYLVMHFYPLHLGMSVGMSLCNVNQKFDCDSVALSSFASLMGMPLAGWGFAANLVMLVMLLVGKWGMTSAPKKALLQSWLMSGGILLASIVMVTVSFTQLTTLCLFCIAAYIFSVISFAGMTVYGRKNALLSEFSPQDFFSVKGLAAWIAIPAVAWLVDQSFLQQYGSEQVAKLVRDAIADWQSAQPADLSTAPTLTKGSSNPKMVISEFADFRCGHCKHAAPSLAAFAKAHPDAVQVRFYNFPLDGACNPAIESSNGISCRLASAVLCSAKLGGDQSGWAMHDQLFQEQAKSQVAATSGAIDELVKSILPQSLAWEGLLSCMDAPETRETLVAQATAGKNAGVRGTPAIFVNQKLLLAGQLPKVLGSVLEKIESGGP